MKVKIINRSHHPDPSYKTELSAGMDLHAFLEESVTLEPSAIAIIPTGIYLEIPGGYEGQVRPRSGLAIKQGITVVNSPGTIDADYRGEVKVGLINLSKETKIIQDGDRIAQLVIAAHATVEWEQAEEITETERGAGGFGSTGTN